MTFQCRQITDQDIDQVLRLLMAEESPDRYDITEKGILDAIKDHSGTTQSILLSLESTPIGALIIREIGGRAGLVVAARIRADDSIRLEATKVLWDACELGLIAKGVEFLQWMRVPYQPAKLAEAWGFQRLAILDYYSIATQALFTNAGMHCKLHLSNLEHEYHFHSANRLSEPELLKLIEATYEGSLDCPEFSRYRAVDEVIESYRAASSYRPEYWRYATDRDGLPCAIVLLSHHAEAGLAEITYMGAIPQMRGRGLGWRLLREAGGMGLHAQTTQLVLAVDHENTPASRLYKLAGMGDFFSEEVWVRRTNR